MKVDYIELPECEECPYRSTEVLKDVYYAANVPTCVNTVLRCRNYFPCKRITELKSEEKKDKTLPPVG